jgi:hypothetical protein
MLKMTLSALKEQWFEGKKKTHSMCTKQEVGSFL